MRLLNSLFIIYFPSEGRDLNDVLLHFDQEYPGKIEFASERLINSDCKSHQEAMIGVPTQYLNDGSCLYILTPASEPPSVDCVNKWLLDDEGMPVLYAWNL